MKIGIIGFGGSGRNHFEIMKDIKGIEIKGAFDIDENAKKEIKARNLKVYNSLEEILDDKEIDTVLISSITSLHSKQSIQALKAGKNVIVEKPMAENFEEAEQMVEIAKEKKLLLTVYHNRRFDPDVEAATKIIERGIIGRVLFIRNMIFSDEPTKESGWRKLKKFGGGVLLDWGPHLIDQVLSLVKEKVESVLGDVRYIPLIDEEQDADNHFLIFIKFRNNTMAEIGFSRVSFISFPKLYIEGEKGTIQTEDWKTGKMKLRYLDAEIKEEIIEGIDRTDYWKKAGKIFYENFIEAFNKKAELLIKPEEALEVMRIIGSVQKIYQNKL
jgi:predicted dehydrogenase